LCAALRLGYDLAIMRTIVWAAVIGVMAATSAFAQAQSSAAMTVSVRVVRNCNIALPGSPRITTQCSGTAEPRTALSAPQQPAPTPSLSPAVESSGDSERAVRVLTVNF
jgi:hypothetical protein